MKQAGDFFWKGAVGIFLMVVVLGLVVVVGEAERRPQAAAPVAAADSAGLRNPNDPATAAQSAANPGDPAATQQVPILVYHSVAPAPDHPETADQIHYRIDPQIFAQQMQYLKANGYIPITLNALANYYLRGITIPQKSVVLTFDDGWYSQYEYAVPILEQDGFTASFFIITDFMHRPYMTWDEVRDLDAHGFEIGSHTEHHLDLAKITDPQSLHDEIFGSKQMIESELGHPITTFVYPDYGTNPAVQQQIQAAGYIAARAGWSSQPNSAAKIYDLKSQEVIDSPNPFSH